MYEIIRRLWRDPIYLGTFLIVGVSLATAFGLDWSGEQVAVTSSGISLLTGAAVKLSKPGSA